MYVYVFIYTYLYIYIYLCFDSFVRLTKEFYNYMKLPNKTCQRTKEKSIKILSNGPIYN